MNHNVFTGFKEQPGRWEVVEAGGGGWEGGKEGERNRLLSINRLTYDLLTTVGKKKLNNCRSTVRHVTTHRWVIGIKCSH